MLLSCENCSTKYSIDDALIPAKGAQAQCPKCGHRTVVRRPGSGATATPAAAAPSAPAPSPAPAPAPALAAAPVPPTPAPARAVPEQGKCSSCGKIITDPFEIALGLCASCQAGGAMALEPVGASVQGDARHAEEAAAAASPSFGGDATRPVPYESPSASGRYALKPEEIPGPFRSTSAASAPIPTAALPAEDRSIAEAAGPWRVRKSTGDVLGPFDGAALNARLESGEVATGDEVALGEDEWKPLSYYATTAAYLRRRAPSQPVHRVRVFYRDEPQRRRRLIIAGAAGLAVVLLVALLIARPRLLFAPPRDPSDASAAAIIERWRADLPGLEGSPLELYQEGRTAFLQDTPDGYRKATDLLRRALVLDPDDARLVAAYVEAEALIAADQRDQARLREALEFVGWAARRGPELPEVFRARANILLASGSDGDLQSAQAAAVRARQLAPEDAEVLTVLGRTFLYTSAEYAISYLEEALRLNPDLRRAQTLLGEAYLRGGRYAKALVVLQKRASVPGEPPGPEVFDSIARTHAAIGDFKAAEQAYRRLLEAYKDHPDGLLGLAQLDYQVEGDVEAAAATLAQLRERPLDQRRKLATLVHSAAVERERGNLAAADAHATAGLQLDPGDAAARFQLALIALAQGKAERAREQLAGVPEGAIDPSRRAEVLGRIEASAGRADMAQQEFRRAQELQAYRIVPFLLSAGLYAQAGAAPQAYAVVRKALDIDPAVGRVHRTLTDFYEGTGPLRAAATGLEALAGSQEDSALARGALAMARYHQGDAQGAAREAAAALAKDPLTLAAHIYNAQLALDRSAHSAALSSAQKAAEVDRLSVLASYLAGRALQALGRSEEARGRYREALEMAPQFGPALVREGEFLAREGAIDQARERFLAVLRLDPENLDARAGLFKLGE